MTQRLAALSAWEFVIDGVTVVIPDDLAREHFHTDTPTETHAREIIAHAREYGYKGYRWKTLEEVTA